MQVCFDREKEEKRKKRRTIIGRLGGVNIKDSLRNYIPYGKYDQPTDKSLPYSWKNTTESANTPSCLTAGRGTGFSSANCTERLLTV